MKQKIAPTIIDYIIILIGSLFFSVAILYFYLPHEIPLGGLSGISMILHITLGLPMGIMAFAMNIPLFFIGWRSMGMKFLARSVFCVGMMMVMLDFMPLPEFSVDEPFMAVLCGGVLGGIGLGLIFSRGGTGGGIDIVSKLVQKKRADLSLGRIALYINFFIFAVAAIVLRAPEAMLYALVTQFIGGVAMDTYLNGLQSATQVIVITEKPEPVREVLLTQVKRGATAIDAKGIFSQQDKAVFLCAIRRYEITTVKRAIIEADPEAFMILSNVQEVLGKGFKPFAGV